MDSIEKLTSAITMVEEARSVPLSASCVVHRSELLEILDDAKNGLPQDFATAQNLLLTRDAILEEGRTSAEQLVVMAREEVARMVEQTSIVQSARDESQRILDDARATADRERQKLRITSIHVLPLLKLFSTKRWMLFLVVASALPELMTMMCYLN